VLAADGAYGLGSKGWQMTSAGTKVGKLVGDVVRRELLAALGKDAEAARNIGDRLARRTALVAKWRVVLRKSDGVFLPADDLARVADIVPRAEHAEVIALEDELERLEAPRIVAVLEQLVATSVRRHELAHLLDRSRPTPLPYPKLLEEVVGPDGPPAEKLFHARGELVGYLSQLIDDPITPHLTLWGVASAAFENQRTAEGRAGTVIVKGIAKLAGADVQPRADEGHRAYMSRLAEPLVRLDGATLRRHAAALWTELYDEPRPAVSDQP
jgi:hypothetical protein